MLIAFQFWCIFCIAVMLGVIIDLLIDPTGGPE